LKKPRLNLGDLVVSSFETQPAARYVTNGPTLGTMCEFCGEFTAASCDSYCVPATDGGNA
jgi:hypothetical protein